MNSLIYSGEVSHVRHAPIRHHFRYPVYFYAFDLDELEELDRSIALFGYNRLRPVAIHDRDYLQQGELPLREKLDQFLHRAGVKTRPQRVVLVTSARYFNYVFNPVSFFYCYAADESLLCIVTQVNNTFGEMHIYLLRDEERIDGGLHWQQAKEFHVSPFFGRDGDYRFSLSPPQHDIDNRIEYRVSGQPQLTARLSGKARPLTGPKLLGVLLRHPISASLTMPRILWQAAQLYWKRRLPVYTKPIPDHSMTIRPAAPTLADRIGLALFCRFFSRLEEGQIQVRLPDGRQLKFGEQDAEPSFQLQVHEFRFFRRVLLAGDIGFGEAYSAGEWSSDDLPGLLTLLARQQENLNDQRLLLTWGGRICNYARHLLRANTLAGSSRNIRAHYDLSNEFFATILDPSMTYSSALFDNAKQSLADAQRAKLQRVIDEAEIGPDDHVLEIGCGWGSFAIEAVRRTGCRVTGITLSNEQLALARQRVREAGLEERIDLQLIDYRNLEGTFSRIVSIEMLEAVGHRGIFTFFETCNRLLAPGGRVVLQVITIPDRRYNSYRFSSDWIRKHIFPGGHLPSIGVLNRAMNQRSNLILERIEQRAPDYAMTLQRWRKRLHEQHEEILRQGYDEPFLRTWDYYFSYCEAGFAARTIDLSLLTLRKPGGAA